MALISAILSLFSAAAVELSRRRSVVWMARFQKEHDLEIERVRDQMARDRESDSKAVQSLEVVAQYRDPLLLSAFDLQSRIYNVLRPGGFRGGHEPEYYRLNTLYLIAQFFGWLEILRREVQFMDLGAAKSTRQLAVHLEAIQAVFASSSQWRDSFYVYRGEQRAIGELMITRSLVGKSGGLEHECLGYAMFVQKQREPEFAAWFERLGNAIRTLPDQPSPRLAVAQDALIDLIDFLDPDGERLPGRRDRLIRAEQPK